MTSAEWKKMTTPGYPKPGFETLDFAKKLLMSWFTDLDFLLCDPKNMVIRKRGQVWWIGQGGDEW